MHPCSNFIEAMAFLFSVMVIDSFFQWFMTNCLYLITFEKKLPRVNTDNHCVCRCGANPKNIVQISESCPRKTMQIALIVLFCNFLHFLCKVLSFNFDIFEMLFIS